jgi:ABC-2 type transport system permease protein
MNTWLVSFTALTRREIGRYMRVWTQTFAPPVISAALYVLVFGEFIGNRIGDVGGMSYIDFLIPGLIAMNVITSTYSGSAFTVFFGKWEKTINDLLTAPMSYAQMVGAILLGGGVVRGVLIGSAVTIVLAFFGNVTIASPVVLAAFVLLIGLFFSSLGMIAGLWAERFDHFNIIQTFIITPLIYLGGVFYSIDTLPQAMQSISRFNPLLYMIDGFRTGMTGAGDVPLTTSFVVVGVLAVVTFVACITLFRTGYKMRS